MNEGSVSRSVGQGFLLLIILLGGFIKYGFKKHSPVFFVVSGVAPHGVLRHNLKTNI